MVTLSGKERSVYVRSMFDRIAPTYDRMNAVMTFGMYRTWQKQAAALAAPSHVSRALDVATGTGDLAVDLTQRADTVVGADFTRGMLIAGRPKTAAYPVSNIEADATSLPIADNSFDCATIGFGLRNIPDRIQVLREMTRVVRPGGRVVCLELTPCRLPGIGPLFRFLFHSVVPLVGGLVSGSLSSYKYLPDSVDVFPDADALVDEFREAGLIFPRYSLYNFGTIAIHVGVKSVR